MNCHAIWYDHQNIFLRLLKIKNTYFVPIIRFSWFYTFDPFEALFWQKNRPKCFGELWKFFLLQLSFWIAMRYDMTTKTFFLRLLKIKNTYFVPKIRFSWFYTFYPFEALFWQKNRPKNVSGTSANFFCSDLVFELPCDMIWPPKHFFYAS